MKDVHSAMMRILTAAMPAIADFAWSDYGAQLRMYSGEVRKYQGVLLRIEAPLVADGFESSQCGVLRDRNSSEVVAARKIAMLREAPQLRASIEARNPDVDDWGGGHVFLTPLGRVRGYAALTGLPELGDHLILAHLSLMCNMMTRDDWGRVIEFNYPGVADAMAYVGMSKDQYAQLMIDLFSILTRASETLPLL